MDTFFLDTNVICYLVENDISVSAFKDFLNIHGNIAVVGRFTHFELAKTYASDEEKCRKLFLFLENLEPKYTLTRNQFYIAEINKMQRGVLFDPFCSKSDIAAIKIKNREFASGHPSARSVRNIKKFDESIRQAQGTWWLWRIKYLFKSFEKNKLKEMTLNIYTHDGKLRCLAVNDKNEQLDIIISTPQLLSYDEIVKQLERRESLSYDQEKELIAFFEKHGYSCFGNNKLSEMRNLTIDDFINNHSSINLIHNAINRVGADLSQEDIKKFLQNQKDYPVLRTLLRSIAYLNIHMIKNNKKPNDDKITDAIQFKEAAYCTIFVSREHRLVVRGQEESIGRQLNPEIRLLHVEALVNQFRT